MTGPTLALTKAGRLGGPMTLPPLYAADRDMLVVTAKATQDDPTPTEIRAYHLRNQPTQRTVMGDIDVAELPLLWFLRCDEVYGHVYEGGKLFMTAANAGAYSLFAIDMDAGLVQGAIANVPVWESVVLGQKLLAPVEREDCVYVVDIDGAASKIDKADGAILDQRSYGGAGKVELPPVLFADMLVFLKGRSLHALALDDLRLLWVSEIAVPTDNGLDLLADVFGAWNPAAANGGSPISRLIPMPDYLFIPLNLTLTDDIANWMAANVMPHDGNGNLVPGATVTMKGWGFASPDGTFALKDMASGKTPTGFTPMPEFSIDIPTDTPFCDSSPVFAMFLDRAARRAKQDATGKFLGWPDWAAGPDSPCFALAGENALGQSIEFVCDASETGLYRPIVPVLDRKEVLTVWSKNAGQLRSISIDLRTSPITLGEKRAYDLPKLKGDCDGPVLAGHDVFAFSATVWDVNAAQTGLIQMPWVFIVQL